MKTILLWDPRFPDRRPARLTVEDTVASAAVRAGVAAAANPAEAGALSAGGALDPGMLTEVALQHGLGSAIRRVFLPYSVALVGAAAGVLAAVGTPLAGGATPPPTPTLTLTGPLTYATNAAAGSLVANIGNVPAGVTPTLTPNDGRVVVAGDATAGWKAVKGDSASAASTFTLGVSAAGANGASAPVTVTAVVAQMLVVMGQSNAQTAGVSGTSGLPSGWANTARVQWWTGSAFQNYNPSGEASWGPEVAWAKAWLDDATNTGKTLYIVKYAVGGSQLGSIAKYGQLNTAPGDWDPTTAPGSLAYYSVAKNAAVAAKGVLTSSGLTPVVSDVIWFQGEADGKTGTQSLADYSANELALYAAIRSQIGDAATVITTHAISALFAPYDEPGLLVQQRTVVANNARNYIAWPRGLGYQSDNVHMLPATVNIMGGAAYALPRGGIVPSTLTASGTTLPQDQTSTITLGARNLDGRSDTAWSIPAGSTYFEVVGATLRVKAGQTPPLGSYNVTVRATNSSGYADTTLALTVANASAFPASNAIIDFDYVGNRYYYNGTTYASIAAMVTAGVYNQDANGDWAPLPSMPAAYTLVAQGVTGASALASGAVEYLACLDDGADGVATDEIVAVTRFNDSASGINRTGCTFYTGGTSQNDVTVQYLTNGGGTSATIKEAARIQTNNQNFACNGSVATVDTSCTPPVLTRLVKGARTVSPYRTWGGSVSRMQLFNYAATDAQLVTLTQ